MRKRIAILQSSYIPWKGYFDIIQMVDEFFLYEDAQFTKRDWRNRNKIKTSQGPAWLTIPVRTKGKFFQSIMETEVEGNEWRQKHWRSIELNYTRAPYFKEYASQFENEFHRNDESLSIINTRFIQLICQILGINTTIRLTSELEIEGDSTQKLVSICKQVGATHYLSGPSAQSYIQDNYFKEAGIELQYMDYSGYPEYSQLFPPFSHEVSAIDLIFNAGNKAPSYMKGFLQK